MNNFKKILFIGLGGAGQRHLRIFTNLLKDSSTKFIAYRHKGKTPLLNEDFTVNNSESIESKFNIEIFNSFSLALEQKPDLAVISTPSSKHAPYIKDCVNNGINIFVEKPFSNNLDDFDEISHVIQRKNLIFYTGYQRRFHPLVQKVQELLYQDHIGKIISAEFYVKSYLPEWHQYENYRDLFAAKKELGGGVLLTEIHEIDLCHLFFGKPQYVSCLCGNFFKDDLDVEDTATLNLLYKNFSASINMCFVQKHLKRGFSISGIYGYIEVDFIENTILIDHYKKGASESKVSIANDELFNIQNAAFLSGKIPNSISNLKSVRETLEIVEAAKLSCKKKYRLNKI